MAESDIHKIIKTKIATKLIQFLSPVIIFVAIIITIIIFVANPEQWTRAIASFALILVLLFNLWLVKVNKVRMAAHLLLFSTSFLLIVVMILHGGVHAPMYASAPLVLVYVASWFYGTRKAVFVAFFLILVGLIFLLLDANGLLLPTVASPSSLFLWALISSYILLMFTSATIPNKILYSSLTESEEEKQKVEYLQNYLSNIIDSMPSVLVGVDLDGKITQWNKTAEELVGVNGEDALGKDFAELFTKRGFRKERLLKNIATKEITRYNSHPRHTENGTIYEVVTIYPLVANGVEGAVIRIDDITKERELERQLNHSRKMDAIGQLAGGVAHDFNNMLAGIIGAAQLLKSPKFDLNEKGLKYVEMITQSVTRAAGLTTKLLSFSRKNEIGQIATDIHTIIDDAVSLLESSIDKKVKISLKKEASNYQVIGDSSALQNALMNIGINSSHAMDNSGELQVITRNIQLDKNYCSASLFDIEPGQYVEIEMSDSGSGISPENLTKIFEPFFTTKEKGKGTGLGLSAVYGTIQDHHGAIAVYSEVGQGTVFHLYLPCSEKVVEAVKKDEKPILGSGLILLVDDEELIRITGDQMLESIGYQVILAQNGREAVEIFQKEHKRIDLVILDMIMPEMNGREAFLKINKIDADIPIIIASGFSKEEDLKKIKEEGLSGFIQKPFMIYELSKIITEILTNKK